MLSERVAPTLALIAALAPSWQDGREISAMARSASDSALVVAARARPDDLRDALRRLLARAAAARADSADVALVAARRLAGAHAIAWRDSFLVHQVERFTRASATARRSRVAGDSLRLVGNAALASGNIARAMRHWRGSLRAFETIADSAGMAAAFGNLGAGFHAQGQHDSAEFHLSRSRTFAARVGDHRTVGNALGLLGSVNQERGELRQAADFFRLAAEVRERTGDTRGLAADRNNLGLVLQDLGDLSAARAAFEEALGANRRANRSGPAAANLVNLGNLASLEGEYGVAGVRYREALTIYRGTANAADAALVLHNLGIVALRRGDYRTAIATLSEAASIYRRANAKSDEIAVLRDVVAARGAVGDLVRSRAALLRAEELARQLGRDHPGESVAELALARADLEVEFNGLRLAELEYGRAERLSRGAGRETTRAAAQQGLGMVLMMREQYARARSVLELAHQAQTASGDRRGGALSSLLIGHAARLEGDTATARRHLQQARDALSALGDVGGEAAAHGALGDLELQMSRPVAAEALYRRGLERLGSRPAPGIAWQLHAGLGRALAARGEMPRAAAAFGMATDILDQVSAPLTIEERRSAYLSDKWEPYIDLALVERARGRHAEAFVVSERLRGQQMVQLLARGRVNDSTEGFSDREQDLRRRIAELTREVEMTPLPDSVTRGAGSGARDAGAAIEALSRAQEEYGELLSTARERQPAHADLLRIEPATAVDVRRALAPDEAFLEYLVGDSTTLVFVITRDTIVALDLNISQPALAAHVDFARGTLATSREAAARQAWRVPMRRLYDLLLAPVDTRGLLAGKRRLLVAPHAELHYLPFAALVMPGPGGDVVLDRATIEYIPSASIWLRLRGRPVAPRSGAVLALAPRVTALPGSGAEVAAIGRIHGRSATVLTGSRATERSLRDLAPGHGIVHLATYGVLNKRNPLFSYVELGAGDGEDGRLEVHEVFGLRLDAHLVVLSACETGLAAGAHADVPPGDDWVGLVRAFLHAGASNVLATLWPVEDRATARLMERFHEGLVRGLSPGEATALAQRAARSDPRTAHPYYWAGFSLTVGR